jgi:hypothetical protein
MKSFQNALTGALALALLSTATSAPATGLLGRALHKLETGKHDSGPPGGSVKVSKPENFKGVTQVVIGQFSVGYFVKNVNYGDNSVFSSASGVKTVGDLSGVDAATFQATTDAVFEDFKMQLAARGITVVEPAAYLSNPNRARLKPYEQGIGAKVQLAESDHAEATVYWPSQMGRQDNVMTLTGLGMMNIARAQDMSATLMGEKDFAKTSGIPVMNVQLLIDFAEPLKTSAGWTGTNVRSGARIAISNYGSQLTMIQGGDGLMSSGGKIVLQSPIVQEGNFADASFQDTNKAGRIIGGLAGLNVQGKAKFHFAVSDQAAYKGTVLAATAKAADLFLGQMQSLR